MEFTLSPMPRTFDLRHLAIAALIASGLGLLGASATGIAAIDDAIRAAERAPHVPVFGPDVPRPPARPEV